MTDPAIIINQNFGFSLEKQNDRFKIDETFPLPLQTQQFKCIEPYGIQVAIDINQIEVIE